ACGGPSAPPAAATAGNEVTIPATAPTPDAAARTKPASAAPDAASADLQAARVGEEGGDEHMAEFGLVGISTIDDAGLALFGSGQVGTLQGGALGGRHGTLGGGSGSGGGVGVGRGRLDAGTPKASIRQGATDVKGGLPPEVIQRIVRLNM